MPPTPPPPPPPSSSDQAPGARPPPANTVRTAPLAYRAPSPPPIDVPMAPDRRLAPRGASHLELVPPPPGHAPGAAQLSARDAGIITRGRTQTATDWVRAWRYEMRRQAQPVLDYLYLGPTGAVRDLDFLRREAITMVLAARDARMPAATGRLVGVDRAVAALGIAAHYVDVDGLHGLVRAYPKAVALVNHHMLAFHHAHAHAPAPVHGKVLVVCESGNERSAAVVAAYIMAMFGRSLVPAIQFVNMQRFCCCFDEWIKRTLRAWEDILAARRAVADDSTGSSGVDPRHPHHGRATDAMDWESSTPAAFAAAESRLGGAKAKRGADDMLVSMEDGRGDSAHDRDRFLDREPFQGPFKDVGPNGEG